MVYTGLPLSMKIHESQTACVSYFVVHQQTGGVHGLQAVEIMESSPTSIKTVESENDGT